MMKYLIFIVILLLQGSCVQGQKDTKENEVDYVVDIFFKQYAYLLSRSLEYDIENERFKYEVQQFVDTCTEYNHGTDRLVKPFVTNNERGGPIILHPYLFNNTQDRVIIMILTKGVGINGKPREKIKYVLGRKEDDKWIFRKKKAHVRGFHYEGGHPLLSDTEMSLRTLRTLINWGYMPVKEVKIHDKFFEKDW